MAETTSQFGKGTALNCGFDLGARSLLDSREIAGSGEELDSMPDIRKADGLKVRRKDTKELVVWDAETRSWRPVANTGDAQVFIDAFDAARKEVGDE